MKHGLLSREVSKDPSLVDNNIELSVRGVKQHFKFGHGPKAFVTKAVDGVSFDIKKGECFGLVGESGCGKTTTGRSLIRLYNITAGDIYFEGERISAGVKGHEDEIKLAKKKARELRKQAKDEYQNAVNALEGKLPYIKEIDALVSKVKNISNELTRLEEEIAGLKQEHDSKVNSLEKEEEATELNNIFSHEVATRQKRMVDLKQELTSVEEELKVLKEKQNAVKSGDLNGIDAKYQEELAKINKHLSEVIAQENEAIAQAKFDNKHVNKKLLNKMQMIFQDPVDSLDPRMTVEDIIQEGLHIQGQYNKYKNSQKVKDALVKVGLLPEYSSRYPHEFSGGQRQRIGIARALIMNPSFLICDEPISALDVSIRAQIINLLNDLKEEMGLTILFIAHDLSVVKYFCDRIAVMYFGHIVELASSDELFKHPLHPYTNALLSAIPKPDPISEKVRQRYVYVPSRDHDYSKEQPKLVEIVPGHFVLANSEEIKKYKEKLK